MPFQSKAQRRKFYALKERGQMSQKKIDEWEDKTPASIPERKKKAFFGQGAYYEGHLTALQKLGLDAAAFEEFVQSDNTDDLFSQNQAEDEEADPVGGGKNNQERLLRQPSPWTGASPVIQTEPVDF
jgi:hypothetical protein